MPPLPSLGNGLLVRLPQWFRRLFDVRVERNEILSALFWHVSSLSHYGRVAITKYRNHRVIADSGTGLVFAMYNIGGLAAVFFTGPLNDYFGRRWGMFVGAVIVIIGTCVQGPSTYRGQFLAGRFVLGFGVSFCAVSAPCYVSEMAHPKWRGTLTGLYNCTWYVGYHHTPGGAPDTLG